MFDTTPAPVFVVQSSEFVRVDYEVGGVTIIATITALHDYADHWQARIRTEFQTFDPTGQWTAPRYQTHTDEARDVNRGVLAQWLAKRVQDTLILCATP